MKIKWQPIGLLLGIGGLLAVAILGLRPEPLVVETALVSRGMMQTTVSAGGRTRIQDRFVIAAPVAGKLARLRLRRGDQVAAGALITWIESRPLEPLDPRQRGMAEARLAAAGAARREAEAVVEQARISLSQRERDRQRGERLVESGDLARQEFEQLCSAETAERQQLAAALSRARMAAAESEAARAALLSLSADGLPADLDNGEGGRLERIAVRSPISGRVLRLHEESERVVAAGTPLIEISNPATLELVIEVLSTAAVGLRPGARVIVDRWGGPNPLEATVRLIEPSAFTKVSALGIEEQRVNVIADLAERPEGLGDGFQIEARLVVSETPETLKVPLSAIFREEGGARAEDGWATLIVEGARARRRRIRIGRSNEREAEVLEGLSEGMKVIIYPPTELVDGGRISEKRRP